MVGHRQGRKFESEQSQLHSTASGNSHTNGEHLDGASDSDRDDNWNYLLENVHHANQARASLNGVRADGISGLDRRKLPGWLENASDYDVGSFDDDGSYTVLNKKQLLVDVEIPDHNISSATAEEAERYLGADLYSRAIGGVADLIQVDCDGEGNWERGSFCYTGSEIDGAQVADGSRVSVNSVSRCIKSITFNESLPIFNHKNEIIDKLERNDVIFVHGDTGCGKSTQIPVYILEHCIRNNRKCNILITQPRRIAATSVASYVASSHNWPIGGLVGYHVSIDRKTTSSTGGRSDDGSGSEDGTCITYCTTGILLQKLLYRPDILSTYTHIIFDEVHERSADLDLAMMFTKHLVHPPNPETKLIIMSATFEATKFWRYLSAPDENAAVSPSDEGRVGVDIMPRREDAILDDVCVTIHSRQFAVDCAYLDQFRELKLQDKRLAVEDSLPMVNKWGDMARWVGAMVCLSSDDTILYEPRVLLPVLQYAASIVIELEITERKRIRTARETGIRDESDAVSSYGKGILIFLPGIEDILTMKALLNQHRQMLLRECGSTLNIVTLHASAVSLAEQMHQFDHAPQRQRRVVLSTNVGESSITLPDIGYVIDLCLTKQLFWSPESAWTSLDVVWASKCSAEQRAGRCGRTCDGFVYRLVPKVVYDGTIPDVDIPEVRRAPIHASVLRAKAFADAAAEQQVADELASASPRELLQMLIEPPSEGIVLKSTMYLKQLGALTVLSPIDNMPSHTDGTLTALGDVCIKLPVDIFVSRFIMLGFACNLLSDAVEIAAILASRDTVLMLHRFNTVDDDDSGCASTNKTAEAVPTGVLIDLSGANTDNRDNEDDNDCDDGFFDTYSQYKRLLVWDNSQHSDTFAFRSAYRVWKRDIRPLPRRADCERACRRLALCHERLEQIHAIEMELRKRLRAMRFLRTKKVGGKQTESDAWENPPNEQAKLLVLKMLLAAAVTPNYFQIVPPDSQVPARHHQMYYNHGATLGRASQDLCHRPITLSVLVCLERDIISQHQNSRSKNGQSSNDLHMSTTNRDADPISVFDADLIRVAFEEMCCRLPIDVKVHFIMPSTDTTAGASLNIVEFVVEFSRLSEQRQSASATSGDGEASLALQMLLHRIRVMSRACSQEKGDMNGNGNGVTNSSYRSVHESASGLPTLFLPSVKHLQIENSLAGNNDFASLNGVIHNSRRPLLNEIKKSFVDTAADDDEGVPDRVLETVTIDTQRDVGAPRPVAYDIKQLFKLHKQDFIQKHQLAKKLSDMATAKCAVFVTRQQQANAENRKLIGLQNKLAPAVVNGDLVASNVVEYDDNFLKPIFPAKIFCLHACDQASVILNVGLADAHRELRTTYGRAEGKFQLLSDWLDEIVATHDAASPNAAKADRFDAVREFITGKCFLYRVVPFPVDETDRSLPYTLRSIYSFFNAVQIDAPQYLRVQVLALQSPTTVLVEFIDFAVSEVASFDRLAFLPAVMPSTDQIDADYEAIWFSVPQLAERVRLGPAKCVAGIHETGAEYASALRIFTFGSICDWMDAKISNVWVTFLHYLDGVYEVDLLFNSKLFGAIRDGVVTGQLMIRDDPPTASAWRTTKETGGVFGSHACVDLAQCQEIATRFFSSQVYQNGLRNFQFMSLSIALCAWKVNGRQHPLAVDATPKSSNTDLAAAELDYFHADEQMALGNQVPVSQRMALPSRTAAPELYIPVTDADLMTQYNSRLRNITASRLNEEEENLVNGTQSEFASPLEIALKWRRVSLTVYSPLLIPNSFLHNLQHALLLKPVAVSFNSVNAVLLSSVGALSNVEHAGRRTEQRMLIATDVSASRSRKTISLRHTTLMPPLPGMLPLCAMLFSPCVDLRTKEIWEYTNPKQPKLLGYEPIAALCGVGSEFALRRPDDRAAIQSMDPARDILVPFDVQFLKGDLMAINRFRRELSCVVALPLRYARRSETPVREKLFYRLLQLATIIGTNRSPLSEVDWDSVYCQVFSREDDGANVFAWHGLPTRYGGKWQEAQVANQAMILEAQHISENRGSKVEFDVPQNSLVFNATSRPQYSPSGNEAEHHVNGYGERYRGYRNGVVPNGDGRNFDERSSSDSRRSEWNIRRIEAMLPEFSVQPL